MSGGVDSSVAAAILTEQGYSCTGVTLKLYGDGDIEDARRVAEQLGIPHQVLDLTEVFRDKVILPFIKSYEEGLTPNPCIYCNRYVKFAFPLFKNNEADCDVYATGHYVQTEQRGSRWLLKKAADNRKDQSYVLFNLAQETLARCCFPLGSLTKNEVWEIAKEKGLVRTGKQESQDICFVPGGDHGAFMEQYTGKRYPPGEILDTEGNVIGKHRGIVRYTLGQRRGLGVAQNRPLYVSAKNTAENTITLGPESSLYSKTLTADRINLIACEDLEKPMRVKVKTRYLQQEHPAWAVQTGPDELRVDFDEAQRAITPGQAAVLYDGDYVVGGGIIKSPIPSP
ncbi:MAG: tRNA 2-thiouridine(34) synthase MnmA [Treponema sp.]|jgi:tRNA-specific 2-thiouridylase|nr:tRNA 2-thiouridine(34) synthase MnmA [Treponema sp.]